MAVEPCSEPLTVTAEDGYVLVEGGCGVAITLTPVAAVETSDVLMDEAARAMGQAAITRMRQGGTIGPD